MKKDVKHCSLVYKPITNGYYWVYCKCHNLMIGAFCERDTGNNHLVVDDKTLYYFSDVTEFLKTSN